MIVLFRVDPRSCSPSKTARDARRCAAITAFFNSLNLELEGCDFLQNPEDVPPITDYLHGRKQDQAHRCQRRGLHRLESQRAATRRLPRLDGPVQENHRSLTKNVGTQHGRLWLIPLHLREWTNWGNALGSLCHPWP